MIILKSAIFGIAVLLTVSSFSFETTKIENLRGQFENGQGNGFVDALTLPGEAPLGSAEFVLYKESTQFRIQTDESEFIWEDVPDFLLDLEKAQWSDISARSGLNELSLDLGLLSGQSGKDSLVIDQLNANCEGKSSQDELLLKALETCSHRGNVEFDKIIWQGSNPFTEGNLSLRGGSFNFSLKAKLDFNVRVKGNGHLSFKTVGDQRELWIRLDKVKASFLTITNKVFDEVEKIQATHIRVQRPYIIIDWQE